MGQAGKHKAQQGILVSSVFTLSPGKAAVADHCRTAMCNSGGGLGSQPGCRELRDPRATSEEGFFFTSEPDRTIGA